MGTRFLIVAIAGLCVLIPALKAQADSQTFQARDIVKQGVIEVGVNAGIGERNRGLNATLGYVGISFFLPRFGSD